MYGDAFPSTGQGLTGNNMFAYCGNNPVSRSDNSGLFWEDIVTFFEDLWEDIQNYDEDNEDEEDVYKSNYFSSYKGTLVIRHTNDFLTSWAIGGVIFLNHNLDDYSTDYKANTLKHEYGHIIQEEELGAAQYFFSVALPSITYNLMSRADPVLKENYYNMPWEYDADIRGGASRQYAYWAKSIAEWYFDS